MPVIYRCKSCGHVLYVFKNVGQDYYGLPTPSELRLRIWNRCPRCGRKLSRPTIDDISVEVNR